jgi:protein SCO1/2
MNLQTEIKTVIGKKLLLFALASLPAFSPAQSACAQPAKISVGEVPEVGIREKLGTRPPLSTEFADESGNAVTLDKLVDMPTILLFVYYRCPSICDPLMRELAAALDQASLTLGKDFRVITISFDPGETPEVARIKKGEILQTMTRRPPDDGWRFLTGREENIKKMTEAAGFAYRYDEKTQTYIHATSLIFLSSEGKIVRYMGGLSFLPAQIKMAIYDASTGRQRSFMKTVERMCYAYDPEGRQYVLKLNRIILASTGLFVVLFMAFLFIARPRKSENKGDSP